MGQFDAAGANQVKRARHADVPGQVYEQFLGKVIRLTAGHQAKVEEKRSKRSPKSGKRAASATRPSTS